MTKNVIYARAPPACKVAKTQGGSLPMLRRFAPALAGLAFVLAAPVAFAQARAKVTKKLFLTGQASQAH